MSSQEEFEKWYESDAMPLEADWFIRDPDETDEYLHGRTQWCWIVWQASREQMKQECIAHIDKYCKDMTNEGEPIPSYNVAIACIEELE